MFFVVNRITLWCALVAGFAFELITYPWSKEGPGA